MNKEELIKELIELGFKEGHNSGESPFTFNVSTFYVMFHTVELGYWEFNYDIVYGSFNRWGTDVTGCYDRKWIPIEEGLDIASIIILYSNSE